MKFRFLFRILALYSAANLLLCLSAHAVLARKFSCLSQALAQQQKKAGDPWKYPGQATLQYQAILEYHLVSVEMRSPSAVKTWLAFKNGENPFPKTIDLASPSLLQENRPFTQLAAEFKRLNGMLPSESPAAEYEWKVLNLRKGDTVVFKGRSFKLGEFRGAGNATHIFKAAGEKGTVRIPILIDSLSNVSAEEVSAGVFRERASTAAERVEHALFFSKVYIEEIEKVFHGVEVFGSDPNGAWIHVAEIQGKTNGRDYMKTFISRIKNYEELTDLEWDQFFRLLELMEANHDLKCAHLRCVISLRFPERQYVHDDVMGEWIVADAESPGQLKSTAKRGFSMTLRETLKEYVQSNWKALGPEGRAQKRATGEKNGIPGTVFYREIPTEVTNH